MTSLTKKLPTVYIIKSSKLDKVYIGSCYTMSPLVRYRQHVSKCNEYNTNKTKTALISSYDIVNDSHTFKILYQFPSKVSLGELRKKEQYYMNKYKNICNKVKAYYEKKEDYKSQYHYNYRNKMKANPKYNERKTCECGSHIVWRHKTQHFNTKKHLLYKNNNKQ